MCGIIGITSNKPVSVSIINSLRKLEYRGYDSAGIATLSNGFINEVKSEGRVDKLEKNIDIKNMAGLVGIGHVRWATHGVPNTINAHPHSSENVSVVHNGIIENSVTLKKYLVSWRFLEGSLSNSLKQKIMDAFKLYYYYEKYNVFISIFYVLRLSLYALKKKIKIYN